MDKQVLSVFFLGILLLSLPVTLVSDFVYWIFFGFFNFFGTGQKVNLVEKLWVNPCEKIIEWGWKKKRVLREVKNVLTYHDVRVDYVYREEYGHNFYDHHYAQRYSCWSEGCRPSIIVQTANMSFIQWQRAINDFRSEHPWFKVKSGGPPET